MSPVPPPGIQSKAADDGVSLFTSPQPAPMAVDDAWDDFMAFHGQRPGHKDEPSQLPSEIVHPGVADARDGDFDMAGGVGIAKPEAHDATGQLPPGGHMDPAAPTTKPTPKKRGRKPKHKPVPPHAASSSPGKKFKDAESSDEEDDVQNHADDEYEDRGSVAHAHANSGMASVAGSASSPARIPIGLSSDGERFDPVARAARARSQRGESAALAPSPAKTGLMGLSAHHGNFYLQSSGSSSSIDFATVSARNATEPPSGAALAVLRRRKSMLEGLAAGSSRPPTPPGDYLRHGKHRIIECRVLTFCRPDAHASPFFIFFFYLLFSQGPWSGFREAGRSTAVGSMAARHRCSHG
jgi:hypothetical protein